MVELKFTKFEALGNEREWGTSLGDLLLFPEGVCKRECSYRVIQGITS